MCIVSMAHLSSYLMGTAALSHGEKSNWGVNLMIRVHLVPKLVMPEALPRLSHMFSCGVIKHRDTFNFYNYYYGSRALYWAFAAFSVSWSYTQSVGLLERGISTSQGRYLHTEQHKHPCLEWDTNPRPSVWASEDSSSCFRPRSHCDRHNHNFLPFISDLFSNHDKCYRGIYRPLFRT
jgi:hypothetical protein